VPWATTGDVLTKLGKTASAQDILMANEAITTYANRTPAASAVMSARDLYWMNSAAVWQAAWYIENVGVETRSIVARHRQDGVEVDYAGTAFSPKEYPNVLAPLAARALRNLSWKASRTLRTPRVATPLGSTIDFVNELSDESTDWKSLYG
jgi:hypothetical protein